MLGIVSGSYVLYGLRIAGLGSVPYPAAVGQLSEFLPPTVILLGTLMVILFPDGGSLRKGGALWPSSAGR
jgi:hypothetical protein